MSGHIDSPLLPKITLGIVAGSRFVDRATMPFALN
jgi:hypothetical protein